MLIITTINHPEWSNRIRRRGIRRVAKKAGVDFGYLSKIVNNKVLCSEKLLDRLRIATNLLSVKQK